jgi:hypothetical protein
VENTARAIPVRTPTEKDWLVVSEAVDSDNIRWAIENFSSFKSMGEDGILSGTLVKIFTACLALEYIPETWQRVRVIFIPKLGLTSYELGKLLTNNPNSVSS